MATNLLDVVNTANISGLESFAVIEEGKAGIPVNETRNILQRVNPNVTFKFNKKYVCCHSANYAPESWMTDCGSCATRDSDDLLWH